MDSTIATPLGPDDPREIGRFKIIGLLGAGGMGEVYVGTAEDGYVAVKRVRPQLVSVERFRREVTVLSRVPADVAPSVLAHDSTAPRPWFATEYVPGLTVDDAVRLHGRLGRDALWHLLAEVAAHLRVVHEAEIVHRDLKPANVMLLRDGAKLIDFGIARAADQAKLTRSGVGYGTSGFTAPEQDAGSLDVDTSADVYSLGALIAYAASGSAPGTVPDIEPVRAVDGDLADIVESCLAKIAEERPTAADLIDRVRDHVPATGPLWPAEVMELIAAREDFAATPVSKMATVPPPMTEVEAEAETRPEPPVPVPPPDGPRRHRSRRLLVAVPIALVVVVGGVMALLLVPFGSPAHSVTRSSNSATAKPVLGGRTTRPSPSRRSGSGSGSASPSASSSGSPAGASPNTATDPTEAAAGGSTATAAPSAAARGPSGPSSDKYYVSGSEVAVPGCAGWMDFNGDLYGTVSAGDASCTAEDVRSDSSIGGDGTTTFQASDYSQTTEPGWYAFFGSYQFTDQICIWNQADPSVTACTSKYTDDDGTVSED